MIRMSLDEIAAATGGELCAEAGVMVDGPVVIDSRLVEAGSLFVAMSGDNVDGHDFAESAIASGARAVVATRRLDLPCIVVPDATEALGKLAAHVLTELRRDSGITVVAVTGSAGKTSVKDLIAHVLSSRGTAIAAQGSFNNEIGVPLTVLRADHSTQYLVIEMGARGLGHVATLCRIAPPDVSVVLNVGTAHLGEFGGKEVTARAKGEIVEALNASGTAVLNADDPLVRAMASRTCARVVTFGANADVSFIDPSLTDQGLAHFTLVIGGDAVEVTVPQLGIHQVANATAAAAVAHSLGFGLADIAAALGTAGPASPMRMQRTQRADGLVVINDAYNANPDSMAAALRTLAAIAPGRGVAVLGEMRELGEGAEDEHAAIGRLAAELGISRVVAVGEGSEAIAAGAGPRAEVITDVDEAARKLVAELKPDEVVLVKASRGVRLERIAQALLLATDRKDVQDQC